MSHHNQSYAFRVKVFKYLDDFNSRGSVQIAGGLISKNNIRLHNGGASNGNALTLTAG
jgi:hypothetical protein